MTLGERDVHRARREEEGKPPVVRGAPLTRKMKSTLRFLIGFAILERAR